MTGSEWGFEVDGFILVLELEGHWTGGSLYEKDWAVNSCLVHFPQYIVLYFTNKMWLKNKTVGWNIIL